MTYVTSLKEEKPKIHTFISGLSIAFKYMIEFDEPRSLEEAIRKLKNFYERLKVGLRLSRIGKVGIITRESGLRIEKTTG